MKKYCWVFTLNNYDEGDKPFIVTKSQEGWVKRHLQWKDVGYVYIGYGMEVSPTTGTPHLQGMVIFKRAVSFRTLKSLSPKAHWEVMRGKYEDSLSYCKKDGKFEGWVLGTGKQSTSTQVSTRWRDDHRVDPPVKKVAAVAPVSDDASLAELYKRVRLTHEAIIGTHIKIDRLIGLVVRVLDTAEN